MKARYINPFTDYGFKKLFGEEGSKNLLISFLNDLLPINDKIVAINFKKNEQQGDIAVSRKAVYDIFCEDEKGSQFIVEMQNAKQIYFKDRALYYSTFPIRDQAQKGDWNFKLEAVYCVGLLGFNFDNIAEGYVTSVQLKDQDNKVFYDKLKFIFIELLKFDKKESELETHFDKWLYFLKNLESFEKIPHILQGKVFEEAFKIAELAGFTPEELTSYEDSLKIYRDNVNVITTAKEEGRVEGKIEGKIEEKIETATEMLVDGESIEKIKKYSKLSEKEILELKKELGI